MPVDENGFATVSYVDVGNYGDATCAATVTWNPTWNLVESVKYTFQDATQTTQNPMHISSRGYRANTLLIDEFRNYDWLTNANNEHIFTWPTTETFEWRPYDYAVKMAKVIEDEENDDDKNWDIKISKNDLDDFIGGDNT